MKFRKLLTLCLSFFALIAISSCSTQTEEEHVCGHVCPTCNKCLDPNCTDPVCASKCEGHGPKEFVDYVSKAKLDLNDKTYAKVEVTLKLSIDGDTTHFYCDKSVDPSGIMKVRYLGVDTPESTGKVEPWGKAASNFTKSKVKAATSIILESDCEEFKFDSTGGRYLAFVWYKTAADTEYRNLNIELMQEGYSKAYSGGQSQYATYIQGAWEQAQELKIKQYGDDPDPDYDYGDNRPNITLKELRENIDDYVDKAIRVDGVVTKRFGNNFIIQDVDGETGGIYAVECFAGYNLSALGWDLLKVSNRVSVAGTLCYSEGFGYTVNDITYMATRPQYAKNIRLIEENQELIYTPVDGAILNDETKAYALQNVLVKAENLYVTRVNTTISDTDSNGAMSLHVKDANGNTFVVRTEVLYENDKKTIITGDRYLNETINVSGTVEEYNGSYQIHVYSANDIEF